MRSEDEPDEDALDDGLPFWDREVFSAGEDEGFCPLTLLVGEGAGVEYDIGANSDFGSISGRCGAAGAGCGVAPEWDPPNVLHPK